MRYGPLGDGADGATTAGVDGPAPYLIVLDQQLSLQ